jgi:superoxide dismutase, Cu-Zn family
MRAPHDWFVVLISAAALAGCGGGTKAQATIEARSGSTVAGTADFEADGDLVTLSVALTGLMPGMHGIHIHEKGDCSAMDGASAGPHWNPFSSPHGQPTAAEHHYGDLGNLEAAADGTASLAFSTGQWTIGTTTSTQAEIVGRAVIIHANPDDFSQPAGNAGMRIGCGVIRVVE